MDISGLSVAELKQLQAQIPKEIERRQKEERSKLLQELEAKATAAGFSLDELVSEAKQRGRAPAAAKYRHPQDAGLTWSGRGRQPRWVAAFIDNGGSLENLLV